MYKTFIQSNLLYAIEVWGHTVTHDSDILNKAQNKSLRILFNTKRTADAWKRSNGNILKISELYKQTIIRITSKHFRNQLPNYFTDMCMPNKASPPIITDSEYKLRSSKNKTSYAYEMLSKANQIMSKTPFFMNCMNLTINR